jgi:hypothetical protein
VAESANHLFKLSSSADPASARDVGLEIATAARLSAAFPYVSPAATLKVGERSSFHLVDGGYYDNYGLVTLAQWLDDALGAPGPPRDRFRIDVIVIRGLVESESGLTEELREGGTEQALKADPQVPPHGWAWQVIAPPSAFLKTRTFGQWAGSSQMFKLLVEKWKTQVTINPILFDFPVNHLPPACRIAPLSWKLSERQQRCIEEAWTYIEQHESAAWDALLTGGAAPTGSKTAISFESHPPLTKP